jgi:hypothetical protein
MVDMDHFRAAYTDELVEFFTGVKKLYISSDRFAEPEVTVERYWKRIEKEMQERKY